MLRAFFAAQPSEVRGQATTWGDWPGETSSPAVTDRSAMGLLAVSGCVSLIADGIATLPVDVFTEDNKGVKTEVTKPRWLAYPTVELDWISWCTQVLSSLLLHGNAYFLVMRNAQGSIVEIPTVEASRVEPFRDRGMVRYRLDGRLFTGELVHIRGMMLAGSDVGVSPLEHARLTIGLGLAAQSYGKDSFDSGLKMPGVIEMPRRALPEQMKDIANAWRRARRAGPSGLPGVLDDGATWKPTGVTSEQAQFLETRQWTDAQICGQLFKIDPRELGIPVNGQTLTYTNGETRRSELLTKAMLPWMIRVEKAISSLLPNPRYMKFNVDGFLRGDSSARWSIYEAASRINTSAAAIGQPPVMTTTEMREYEDLNVIEEYPGATNPQPEVQQNSAPPVVVNAYITVPESRAEAPSVTVQNDVHVPEQRTPVVNVEPPGLVVDVQPTTVHVPAPEVRYVEREPETRTVTKTIHRDGDGRIQTVTEEIS